MTVQKAALIKCYKMINVIISVIIKNVDMIMVSVLMNNVQKDV